MTHEEEKLTLKCVEALDVGFGEVRIMHERLLEIDERADEEVQSAELAVNEEELCQPGQCNNMYRKLLDYEVTNGDLLVPHCSKGNDPKLMSLGRWVANQGVF